MRNRIRESRFWKNAFPQPRQNQKPKTQNPKPKTELQPATDRQVRITAESIAKLRRKLGLTQMQLAALLEVSNFSVSHWELGKTAPREAYKCKIAALRDMGKRELKCLLKEKNITPTAESPTTEISIQAPKI